jgi:hypothetical protein
MTVDELKSILSVIPGVRPVKIVVIDGGVYLGDTDLVEVEVLKDRVRLWVDL